VQLLPIFCRVFSPRALAHDPERRDAISQSCYLVIEVGPVAFFDHVVRRLLDGMFEVVIVVVVVDLGRRLALSAVGLGEVGGVGG